MALEPLVDLVGVVAVDVGLGHEREGHAVVDLAELGDLLVALGLLAAKLVSGCVRRGAGGYRVSAGSVKRIR